MKRLIFICIIGLNGKEFNLQYQFSNEFHCTFDQGMLFISKHKARHISIFPDHIEDVHLIVGKNGTGKSITLDIFGGTQSDRERKFSFNSSKWFAIYEEDQRFLIEGWDHKMITNWIDLRGRIRIQYSIIFEYDFDKNHLVYKGLYDHRTNRDECIYLIKNPSKKQWSSNIERTYSSDGFYGIKRYSSGNKSFSRIYRFIEQNIKPTRLGRPLIKFRLNENNNTDEYAEFMNLYNGIESPRAFIWQKYSRSPARARMAYSNLSENENFVIIMMETVVLSMAALIFQEDDHKLEIESEIKRIGQGINNFDDMTTRVEYLLKVTNALFFHLNRGRVNHHQADFYNIFIHQLLKLQNARYSSSYSEFEIDMGSDESLYHVFLQFETLMYTTESSRYPNIIEPLSIYFMNLSDGEIEFVDILSEVSQALDTAKSSNYNKIYLLIDEPDSKLHPEWQRLLINEFIGICGEDRYRPLKTHLILTTHSPFLISDVPSDHVFQIHEEIQNGTRIHTVKNSSNSFMTHIYDLLKDNFFLDYTIGEYAKNYIIQIKDRIDQFVCEMSSVEHERIIQMIEIIDNPLIKSNLTKYLHEKRQR